MGGQFVASLSRSQGRRAWAVIFRHPVRIDMNTGKTGLRVRQGLGTADEVEAENLRDQLNLMLADESYWSSSARGEAERRFHPRAVEIFFHGMEPEEHDFGAIRDSIVKLPPRSRESDYRRALLLGTTGAGKTTLLRQLLGTDPDTERFPSTSTAKTTVHETEAILDDGPYRAVVTFFPIDEVREHLNECISEAILAAYRGDSDADVLRKLLMHVNQRFRFNYVLGNGPRGSASNDDDEEDDGALKLVDENPAEQVIDLEATNALLSKCLAAVRDAAKRHGDRLKSDLGATDEKDQRVIDELFEEELDRRLREDEEFHRISDDLMDEIELRFSMLDELGTLRRNKQGWPQSWSWQTDDRKAFIRIMSRFSGNHARDFGRLITPLVNGVRVAGPFMPTWNEGQQPKLVLLDGEGLGHTPKSAAAISSSLNKRIDSVDAVVLIDDATIPMQAAPVAAMKEMITSGGATKLLLVFTHFDEVKGDNLPNATAREQHVLASAENVLASIGEELGPFAERALRGRLKDACFFVGGIDKSLDASTKLHKRTIGQLQALLVAIDKVVERPASVKSKPAYDRMNLVLAVKSAAESFHDAWWPRLGLGFKPGAPKEHWKRIWALSRRLSTPGWIDEYDNLKPVADLRQQLKAQLYVLLQNPVSWDPIEPTDDAEKQQVFDELAEALSERVQDLASRRVRAQRMPEWQMAFNQSGRGSSYIRASIIGERIFDRAAPVPDVVPTLDRNAFLRDVTAVVESVCQEMGASLG
jgi:GTPase Era involved in 16S rRNA processing